MKLRFILEALDGITTPYVLVLDASDVVIDHLDDIIEKFQSYDKKVLFGASLTRYPCIAIDIVKDRKRLGPYHYLNAGTCIGKTEDVRDFYQLCVSLDLEDNEYFSEQFIVRTAFNISQDKVFFDYKRLCFQTMGKAEIKATGRPDVEEVI
jgi:hypothetical protein